MAQGVLKKQKSKSKPAVVKRNAGKMNNQASKSIKPKRAKAKIEADALRKHLWDMTKTTEGNTTAKAGHLDVLKKAISKADKKKNK